MKNGTIKLVNNKFQGNIRTLTIAVAFWFENNLESRSDKAPRYLVMAKAPDGGACQIGAAWERTINKGSTSGLSMFQLTLDDPSFGDEPLHFNAFPNLHEEWFIQPERKRQAGAGVGQGTVSNGAAIPGDFGGDQVAAVG